MLDFYGNICNNNRKKEKIDMDNQEKNFSTNNKQESEANLFETANGKVGESREDSKKENTIALVIKVIAVFFYVIALLFLLSLIGMDSVESGVYISYAVAFAISGTLFLGFGEIINLLQKLLDKK